MATKIFITSMLCLSVLSTAIAAPQQPLLIPGKSVLFQRILTIPGASMQDSMQESGAESRPITPFSAYYVYQRDTIGDQAWLQIGTDRHGDISGWLPANQTIEWNQGLTIVFRNPAGQDRALLFDNKDALKKLVAEPNSEAYEKLYQQAIQNTLPGDSPVIAIQPAGHLDIQKDFYLVPIRAHEDLYLQSEQARMLQISSIPLEQPAVEEKTEKPANEQNTAAEQKNYSSGLVFAIDATLSMDEYIDRTREAVTKIYDRLGDSGLLGDVNFGLVAFRDNVQSTPGLEYLTKTFVTLEQGRDPGTFLQEVNGLSAADVSSKGFREDAYAGIKQAIEDMDWSGHDARYIVLITDAGAREGDDPLSATGLNAESLRQMAQDKGIALFVLHLKTPSVMANHAEAENQYRALSHFPGIGSLYYGVPTGDVTEFGQVLDALAGQITDQVKLAAAPQTETAPAAEPEPSAPEENTQLSELQSKVSKLGHALRMQYLQKSGEQLPTIFDAWILDRDFSNPDRTTLDVRVLLSRDQLSDLHDVLKQVLVTAEEGLLSPENFLDELKSLAATISRDPEQLGATTATTAGEGNSLANLGFMREYTEDLPYTSEVMDLSLEDWQSWPARQQIRFLNGLEEKIAYYGALHDHTDLWISLDGGPVDGDSVFPVSLEMLP